MLKKCVAFVFLIMALMLCLNCSANEQGVEDSQESPALYDLETNQSFIVDFTNSTNENLRICVPILYPEWFSVPTSCVEEMKVSNEKTIDGQNFTFARIQFKKECTHLNSLLEGFQELIYKENSMDDSLSINRWRWRFPWHWSSCGKCKLAVNTFITVSVIAAAAAAGTTGPGAYAVWQALIVGKYGLVAWKAVEAGIFGMGVTEISRRICVAQRKCK